ncbi:hypothetical protein AB0N14_26570 [Streptomyces sp. NPDC051104]|uniref:hypothetical protein n=1 Tax=Streptomyces sp. NPDC051104 TaxID=3155044 RepID=UPI00341DFB87
MIEERHIRELLGAQDVDAALILVQGSAEVVNATKHAEWRDAGAAVLMTKGELLDRLGTSAPTERDLVLVAQALRDMVGKLGA